MSPSKFSHQTNYKPIYRDLIKSTLGCLFPALLLTSALSLAQDKPKPEEDATLLPPYEKLPLCDDPISTYSCLKQDPTLTEAWEHLESDSVEPDSVDHADRDEESVGRE